MQEWITSTTPLCPTLPPYGFSLLWEISKGLTTNTKWRFIFFFWAIKTVPAPQTGKQDGVRGSVHPSPCKTSAADLSPSLQHGCKSSSDLCFAEEHQGIFNGLIEITLIFLSLLPLHLGRIHFLYLL